MNATRFPVPPSEAKRLRLLADFDIVGSPPEREFDRFADLAAKVFGAPVALVTFVDADRVWLKARSGVDLDEIHRGDAFCAHTILEDDVLVIPDTHDDDRFRENPFVNGPPHVRFYAGAPLIVESGHAIGTICVLDVEPRPHLSDHERRILADIAVMAMDRLQRRQLEKSERAAHARFLKIAETSPDAIVCADEQGRLVFANEAVENVFGYRAAEVIGRNVTALFPEQTRPRIGKWFAGLGSRQPEQATEGQIDIDCLKADGSAFPASVSYSSWHENGGLVVCGIARDITARRDAESKLRDLARRDPLTQLPNRAAFLEQLESAIRAARQGRNGMQGCALLLVDLDRFKEINDTLGHGVGDRLLQRLSERLASFASASVHVARLSGDEFTIIIEGETNGADAAIFAEGVRKALSRPLRVRGQQVDVGASIGIATYPEHGTTANDLLANADLALYRAKGEGGENSQIYVSTLRDAATSHRRIEAELARAHRENEFVLFFQPQVSVHDRTVLGAEALIRWRHPTDGLMPPMSFLPVLEKSPVATPVGAWIVETAIAAAAEWSRICGRNLRVGINLFASQFFDPNLTSAVMSALERNNLPPDCLELEITENIALRHDTTVATPLRRMIDAGVSVAFDDFGTGYGSLTYLKHVPVTRLKIDRSFVQGIISDAGDAAIVRAVVALGRSLGLGVIAEGVETEAQRLLVETLGCAEAQGYLFGKPMAPDDFITFLEQNARRVA